MTALIKKVRSSITNESVYSFIEDISFLGITVSIFAVVVLSIAQL